MKNHILLSVFLCFFSSTLFAQSKTDKVFAQDEVKEVNVKEVTDVAIKYTYPGEETIYTINKMLVSKIQFASGREETFQKVSKYINNLEKSSEVYITTNPNEVIELEHLGMLNTSITNVGSLITINQSNKKQLEKLKLEAAMLGANVVLIENVQQGLKTTYSDYSYPPNLSYTSSLGIANSTVTQYYKGLAYRTHPFNIIELRNKIAFEEYHLMTIKLSMVGKLTFKRLKLPNTQKKGGPFSSL